MPKKLYKGQIPFRDIPEFKYQGKLIHPARSVQLDYPDYGEIIWKDNVSFFAKLQIEGMSRGRSAANFSATISKVEVSGDPEMSVFLEGKEVNLFMVDMLDIVKNSNLYAGATARDQHVWTFCKRGMSYGLTRVV